MSEVIGFPVKQGRISVNINAQTEDVIRRYMAEHDVTATEAIRRLVPVGAEVLAAIDEGERVLLKKRWRLRRRLIIEL